MNWNEISGKWIDWKGRVKEQWGRLSDDDLDVIEGQRDQLLGKLEEVYGMTREKAREQIEEFEKSLEKSLES